MSNKCQSGIAEILIIVAFIVLTICLVVSTLGAGEVEECQRLAPKYNSELEVVQWDKSRVDLLNEEYAIEADWAPKWAEAVGQSLYYSILTNKKPAIILLVKDMNKEAKYIYRCQSVCVKHNIKLYIEEVEDE